MNTPNAIRATTGINGSRSRGCLQFLCPRLILIILIYKTAVLSLTLLYAQFYPSSFSIGGYEANFHWPQDKKPGFAERFMTWDGEHYLYLSENGYKAGLPSDAFYPLWPALIYLATKLTLGYPLVAALISANLLSLVAWLLFYKLVADTHGKNIADCALLLLVAYPGSLFFSIPLFGISFPFVNHSVFHRFVPPEILASGAYWIPFAINSGDGARKIHLQR